MISFELLADEDIRMLLDIYSISFLQQPFHKPAPSLRKYVPNGFRAQSLQGQQLLKAYTHALKARESSLTMHLSEDLTNKLESCGAMGDLGELSGSSEADLMEGVLNLTTKLWEASIELPAHVVLLASGISCVDSIRDYSNKLFFAFKEIIAQERERSYERGLESGQSQFEKALAKEQKKIIRQQKEVEKLNSKLEDCKEQNEEYERSLQQLSEERDEEGIKVVSLEKREQQLNADIERLNKKITVLDNTIVKKDSLLKGKAELEKEIQQQKVDLEEKSLAIIDLQERLDKANRESYSDAVIMRISTEAVDELRALKMSHEELLRLAKDRFNEADTVSLGWTSLSEESKELLEGLLNEFSSEIYNEKQLDVLERLEDNELIKHAVIKAIKATLYHSLEKQQDSIDLSERLTETK